MTGRTGAAGTAVALSVALLVVHAGAEVLGLPGLHALDVADRLGSVAGIAALTLVMEQGVRRRRWGVLPLALAGQLGLLALPSLLHADAVGATYDPRALLGGVLLQVLLSLAVVAVALRLEDAVEALLARAGALPAAALLRPVGAPAGPVATRRGGRPPGRSPPVPLAA